MDELRAACAEIARRARSVRIETAAIAAYADSLPLSPDEGIGGANEAADAGGSEPGVLGARFSPEDRAAFTLGLDAINFGSGWFPTLRKDKGPPARSGYRTIAAAWRRRAEAEGPFTAEELAVIDPGAVALMLDQDPAHELMELFALSLRDLGARLRDGYGGRVLRLVEAAGGSAVRLADELGGWPCFADRSRYEELSVPFLKRAQIAAADLQRAGVADWVDTARLTMFADNLVPHVLRLDGVLAFDPGLLARIDAGELIEHGAPEEVEIRACALHAVELIVDAGGDRVTAAEVDELLWARGQGSSYKARPRHRSRCTAY